MEQIPWETILTKLESVGMEMTEGVKTGVEFMWPLAVRQAILTGIGYLLGAIFVGIIACWGLRGIFNFKEETKDEQGQLYAEDYLLIAVFRLICGGCIVFLAGSLLFTAIKYIINPQWYAIHELLQLLR